MLTTIQSGLIRIFSQMDCETPDPLGNAREAHVINDELDKEPSIFVFHVPGHIHGYHLTQLLPYYGTRFCQRIADAWSRSAVFAGRQTSQNYFKSVRRALLLIAFNGTIGKDSERRILEGFRDKSDWTPTVKDWEQAVVNLSAAILNPEDDSFIASQNPASRNKKLESLRVGFRWLSNAKMIPPDVEPQGRLEDRKNAPSRCLATLSLEAGRLDLSGLSLKDAAQAFADRNREMIDEIRRCLWAEMRHNFQLFRIGEEMMGAGGLPTVEQVDVHLQTVTRGACRRGTAFEELKLGGQQKVAMALKLLRHRATGGGFACGEEKMLSFVASVINHRDAQPYFEATLETANAAFHLALIDTGGNIQPIEDLPLSLYLGPPKNGKQQVRVSKTRSGSRNAKVTLGHDLYLTKRDSGGVPSGVDIVETWKTLTYSMRAETGPTATRLWLWREPGKIRVGTTNVASDDRWKAFLRRVADNPLIGGLPITRQILRTAVANSRLNEGDFDFRIIKALMGHSADATTFEYMSEGGVRAFLNNLILQFLNAWEAISTLGIDDVARHLGISEDELQRRRRLGLDNGLLFAATSGAAQSNNSSKADEKPELLVPTAKIFSVTTESLIALELARRALQAQMEKLISTNPTRFLRKWVPWLAIVEGYCQKLESTGHRVKFRKARERVDRDLASGHLHLPLLW